MIYIRTICRALFVSYVTVTIAHPASAQDVQKASVIEDEVENTPEPLERANEPTDIVTKNVPSGTIWLVGLSSGILEREDGPISPYATASITAYRKNIYVRGGVTYYRSTLEQTGMARPSTYYVGSLGGGGNFNNWLVDGYISIGRQHYGKVETPAGVPEAPSHKSSGYFAGGLRAGHVFEPVPRLLMTPTIEIQYVEAKSLRQRFEGDHIVDFEVADNAVSGNATFRFDYALGQRRQHLIGISLGHYESNNGQTQVDIIPPAANQPALIRPYNMPDVWQQIGGNVSYQANKRIWIDANVMRTFGVLAGDSTIWTIGVRFVP